MRSIYKSIKSHAKVERKIYTMKRGVRQHDTRDCGAACLATILLWYGANIPIIELRETMRVDKNGASILAICKTAKVYGLDSEGYYAETHEFLESVEKGNIKLPVIVHTILDNHLQHYVIVKKIKKNKIIIFDPRFGEKVCSEENFKKIYTGFFITVIPSANFSAKKKEHGRYKKYFKIITRQKRRFFCAIICSLIAAIASIVASLAYQTIIDKYILGREWSANHPFNLISANWLLNEGKNAMLQLIVAVAAIYIIQALIGGIRGIIVTYIFKNSTLYLMKSYYEHLLRLPIKFFHDRETGEILSRFQDIDQIQTIVSGIGLTIILDFFMATAGGIVLCSINTAMFIIVAFMLAIYGFIALLYKKPIRNTNREIFEANSQITCELKEAVDGIESIKALGVEGSFGKRLFEKMVTLIKKEVQGNLISVSQATILTLIESLGNVLVLYIGCHYVLQNIISLGQFIAFETLIYFFISPMQGLLSLQLELQKGLIAADRLDDILEAKTEDCDLIYTNYEEQHKVGGYDINVKDLSFAYGFRDKVLDDVSFSVKQSEKVLIKGKSGCGKTTLLQLLSKIETEYEGSISYGGAELKTINSKELRKHVIYVPQTSELFSGTIMENIILGRIVSEQRLESIIHGCQLAEFIYGFDEKFDKYIEENGKNLSGGQKQRIALARALIMKPEVLLLDESLCHVDEAMERSILKYIWDTFPGMTIISVSHKVYSELNYDRIIDLSL